MINQFEIETTNIFSWYQETEIKYLIRKKLKEFGKVMDSGAEVSLNGLMKMQQKK